MKQTIIAVFTAIILFTSCDLLQRNEAPVVVEPKMLNSADSMSYVMGLNLGLNLIAADSMLNAEMVCMGIRDVYAQSHKLTDEEARNAFLKYMNWDNYERVKAFETQFLDPVYLFLQFPKHAWMTKKQPLLSFPFYVIPSKIHIVSILSNLQ